MTNPWETSNARVEKDLTRMILDHPSAFEWSLQGFGMLRTYISDELRLHIWDSRYKVQDVSELHTHPWNFHSLVIAGSVKNYRYHEVAEHEIPNAGMFMRQLIQCGPGGCEKGDPVEVGLCQSVLEMCDEGQRYSQLAEEIHRSDPADGTVTLISREFLDDTEHAYVYYPSGLQWVSAEPRPATDEEVADIVGNALERWF